MLARIGIQVDQSSVNRADAAITKVKNGLLGLAGAYGIKKIYDFVQAKFDNIANTATDLTTLAQKTGMSTEALQELQYAAAQTNVDAGELRMGLVYLQRAAYEAATMGGQMGAAFQRLGIQVTGANGKLRPTNELLGMIGDKFATMPDGTEKTALSMELLSRSGSKMIPILNQGSAGLARMGLEARKTGGVMSDGMVRQGLALHRAMVQVQYALQGLTYAVFGPFVRAMTEGKNSFAAWIAAHRYFISLRINEVVSVIAGAFQLAARAVKEFGSALGPIGAIALAVLFPFQALLLALVFFANDLNRYLDGKDSIIGRLMYGLQTMMKNLGIDDFLAAPLDNSRKLIAAFLDWTVDQFALLPDRIARAVGDKKMKQWSDYVFKTLGLDIEGALLPDGSRAAADFDNAYQPATSAFHGIPGSQFSVLQQQAAATAPSVTIGKIEVVAPPGISSPKDFGQQIASSLQETLDDYFGTRLREAAPGR